VTDRGPAWSPDGTRIAFNRETNGRNEIMVMNADGTNVRQLTQGNHNPGGLTWSANSTKLLYGNDTGTGLEFFVMNADGTGQHQLTKDTSMVFKYLTSQSWSPTAFPMGSDTFTDIPNGHQADRPIGWAAANRITTGTGQGRFDPDGTVTRAQIVTFLHRLTNLLPTP